MSGSPTQSPNQIQVLLEGPALDPPPGITPNLVSPPSMYHTGVGVQICCLTVASLAIAMRLYTKVFIICQIQLADYSLIAGWLVFVGYLVPGWLFDNIGAGVHQWNVRLEDLRTCLYYVHIDSIMYGVCIFFVKISILLQYVQIFVPPRSRNSMFWAAHLLIWINFLFYVITTFIEIFPCSPIAAAWDPLITDGHCVNILALNVAASSINSASDVAILVLPQISIWRLHMAFRRKSQISAIFLIGAFACTCSIVRLAFAVKLLNAKDRTYYTWMVGVWTFPELASAILVACLPVSAKFFQGLKEMRIFSRAGTSLKSLLNISVRRSRQSTSSTELGSNKPHDESPHMLRRHPRQYETLSNGPSSADQSKSGQIIDFHGDPRADTYIMRTISFETRSIQEEHEHDISTISP